MDLSMDDDGCKHLDVRVNPDDHNLDGKCFDCGETGFPIFDEHEIERAELLIEKVWSDLTDRLGYVPATLQPEDRMKLRWKQLLLETRLEVSSDPEGDSEDGSG